ncbi:helix-turn-helix domain-containing protein [Streptomyces sp. NPDC088350]|uniref:helix-turn-helix domain-containing protein n=1 Tax=Streptomyces sp. NPDC088350 TaxID=3365854 RepID=UPI00381E6F8C
MDTRNFSAPACPQQLNPRGITHINTPHTTRYTVVGNHLAQHRQLSLTAIGLALHIQSLPEQTRVDIKTLADRFPEGETRIAAALRELKAHGYLAQVRKRLPNGRVVTHTVSYNQPQAQPPEAASAPATLTATPRPPAGDVPPRPATPTAASRPPADVPPRPAAEPEPGPAPQPEARPEPDSRPAAARLPLPAPQAPDLDRHRKATALLSTLHHQDPRLLLPERAVRRLAPAVAAWLERGARPEAVRHTLTADLPEPLRNPAALLTHRLAELLPPPVPMAPPLPQDRPAAPPPFHNCEGCDRAIRTARPGAYCRDCRTAGLDPAAA